MTNSIKQKVAVIVLNRTANYALIALIFVVALSYVYFANAAVRSLSTLEKTKQKMQSLSMEVSEMESKRLSAENKLNSIVARQLGFVEVKQPIFIVKNSQKTAFSIKID